MRKIIEVMISTLMLTACGGDSDSSNDQVNKHDSPDVLFYAYIEKTPGLIVGLKTYHLKDTKLLVQNELPEEIEKNYVTVNGFSSTLPPQLNENSYLIGENASFDGKKLQYSVSNVQADKPLILTSIFKKIDVSGLHVSQDTNNPITQMYSSATGQVIAAILGVRNLTETDIFPKGSICWQRLSTFSNQDYIRFDSLNDYSSGFEHAEVELSGNWSNVAWSRYKNISTFPNTQLTINAKNYWGLYYSKIGETLPESAELKCDLMNETAYKKVSQPFEKINTPAS